MKNHVNNIVTDFDVFPVVILIIALILIAIAFFLFIVFIILIYIQTAVETINANRVLNRLDISSEIASESIY